jgi:hypothetical protein
MPLGSSKLGFVKNAQYGVGGTGIPVDNAVNITESYTGNVGISLAATTFVVGIDSSFANTTVGYEITGNISSTDFVDSTIAGNITLDANGNATLLKEISTTTGTGHKDFSLRLIRPGSNVVLANTTQQHIYEMLPIEATGGDSTQFSGQSRLHWFTTGGNANITITNTMGNYTGNTNVWNTYFRTDSASSYFDETKVGLQYRSLIVGAAPDVYSSGQFNGAGELGVLEYPLSSMSTGEFTMQVGIQGSNANYPDKLYNYDFDYSKTFVGTSLERGARHGGGNWVSSSVLVNSGGSGKWGSPSWINVSGSGSLSTDLAENVSVTTFPNNFKQYVTFASGSDGSQIGANAQQYAGGGAFGIGGPANASYTGTNGYGFDVGTAGAGRGGSGVTLSDTENSYLGTGNTVYSAFQYNPVWPGSFTGCGGGGNEQQRAYVDNRGSGQQFLIVINSYGSLGQTGYGGAGVKWAMVNQAGTHEFGPYQTSADAAAALQAGPRFHKQQGGVVTLSYPYADTKFVTGTAIT